MPFALRNAKGAWRTSGPDSTARRTWSSASGQDALELERSSSLQRVPPGYLDPRSSRSSLRFLSAKGTAASLLRGFGTSDFCQRFRWARKLRSLSRCSALPPHGRGGVRRDLGTRGVRTTPPPNRGTRSVGSPVLPTARSRAARSPRSPATSPAQYRPGPRKGRLWRSSGGAARQPVGGQVSGGYRDARAHRRSSSRPRTPRSGPGS